MRKIIEYIKSTPIIIILLIPFHLIAIITFIDDWLQNYDINTGWEQFILANGLEWLMLMSAGLFIFTLASIGAYFFISLASNLSAVLSFGFKKIVLKEKGTNENMTSSELLGFIVAKYWYIIVIIILLIILFN
tara:strand:+ start:180 stop:578 length:399 start_codon:yes stop_codon:yes gene_type:complete